MVFCMLGIVLCIVLFVVSGFVYAGDGRKVFKLNKRQLISLLCLLLCVFGCFKSVPTGHTGVVTVFGAVQNETLEAGIHLLSPFAKVINIDNRTQKATVSMSAFSSDIQEVEVTYTVNYSIDKSNAQKLYREIGLNYFDTVISPKVAECVKDIMAKYTAENLVSARSEVARAIETSLSKELSTYNIQVVGTSLENLDFTDVFTDAVEAKQVAEQNKLRVQTEAETKKLQAEADAEVQIVEAKAKADALLLQAEAEAEANKMLSQSLTDKVLESKSIEKWNGELPVALGNNSNILDLTGLGK